MPIPVTSHALTLPENKYCHINTTLAMGTGERIMDSDPDLKYMNAAWVNGDIDLIRLLVRPWELGVVTSVMTIAYPQFRLPQDTLAFVAWLQFTLGDPPCQS